MEFFELNSTLKWTIKYLSLMVSRAKNIRRFEFPLRKKGIDKDQKHQPMLNSNILAT